MNTDPFAGSLSLGDDYAPIEQDDTMGFSSTGEEMHIATQNRHALFGLDAQELAAREKSMRGLRAVALMDGNKEEFSKLAQEAGYGYYKGRPTLEPELATYGKDFMKAMGYNVEPMEFAQSVIDSMEDENRRKVYQQKLDQYKNMAGATSDTFHALVGEIHRDGVLEDERVFQEEQAAANKAVEFFEQEVAKPESRTQEGYEALVLRTAEKMPESRRGAWLEQAETFRKGSALFRADSVADEMQEKFGKIEEGKMSTWFLSQLDSWAKYLAAVKKKDPEVYELLIARMQTAAEENTGIENGVVDAVAGVPLQALAVFAGVGASVGDLGDEIARRNIQFGAYEGTDKEVLSGTMPASFGGADPASMMMTTGLKVGRLSSDERVNERNRRMQVEAMLSKEEREVRRDLMNMTRSMRTGHNKNGWDIVLGGESTRDFLAQGIGYTLAFLPSGGAVSFLGSMGDSMDENLSENDNIVSALTRGAGAAGIEWTAEKIFGIGGRFAPGLRSSLGRGLSSVAHANPVMRKSLGSLIVGGNKIARYGRGWGAAFKSGMYRSAAARAGVDTVLGAGGEMAEELFGTWAGTYLDTVLAASFGETNTDSWNAETGEYEPFSTAARQSADLVTNGAAWLSFLGMGAGFTGLRMPAYRYQKSIVTASSPELVAMGVDPSEAPRIASIADPDKRIEEAVRAGATGRVASPQEVAAARGFIVTDMSAIEDFELYDTLMKTGVLPEVKPALNPDGSRKKNARGEELWTYTTPRGSVNMTEDAASEAMAGAMLKLNGEQQAQLANLVLAGAMVNKLTDTEGAITQRVGQRMDAEYFKALSDAAKVKIEQGADPNSIDASIDPGMELGELVGLRAAWQNRLETARHDKEQQLGRTLTDAEEKDLRRAYSPNNRQFSKTRNATLFRFARGEIGVDSVLEEVVEDSIDRDMARTGRGVAFYVDSIRQMEKEMGKEGAFLADKPSFTKQDIIEAVGKMVRGKVLADTAKPNNGLSDWVNDFLSLVRKWVNEVVAMVKLGDAVNKVLSDSKARERLGDEFVNMVEDLAHQNTEFMRGLQRDATLRYTMDAATRKTNPTPTLTAAMEKHGAQVRKETEEREQRHKALSDDIAAANAIMDGEEPAAPQEPATLAEAKQEPAHPVDELTQDEETRAWGKAIFNKARSERGRRKALDMVRLAPQLRESGVDVTTEAGAQKAADMAEYAARCREQLLERARKPLGDATQARVLATLMGWERWHELGELVDEAAAWDGKKRVTPKLIGIPKEGTDFSAAVVFSPSEESGLQALRNVVQDGKSARFRSDTLGEDVELFLGSAGQPKDKDNPNSKIEGAHGLMHIITMRMAHGESLEDAVYTAAKAVLAAVRGRINEKSSTENKKELSLDGYRAWVYLKWHKQRKAWLVTGYKQDDKTSSADDRRRAMNLAERYAANQFGGFEELGAALEKAIARIEEEHKAEKGKYPLSLQKNADFSSALRFSDSATSGHSALSAGRMAFAQAIAENVSKMLAEEVARFRSYDGKVRGSREKALVAIGAVYNMARSVSMLMPAGYRVNVHPYMKQLQVFAELAATGDLDLTADIASQKVRDLDEMQGRMADWQGGVDAMVQEYGNAKVNEVLAKILTKVGDSLTKMERDVAVAAIQKLFEQLAPKKDPKTGKLKRGVMQAEGYEEMEKVAEAMKLDAESLDKKLAEIEAGIAKAEQNEEEAEILRLQGEHILFSTYGNLAGMNLAQVMEAYRSLQERVRWNRWAWDEVLASRRHAQLKMIEETVQGVGGRPSINKVKAERERKKIAKRLRHAVDSLMSYPQAMTVLKKVGAGKLAKSLSKRLNKSMEDIKTADRERWIKIDAVSRQTLGKSWTRNMNRLHEMHDTGIPFEQKTYGTATVSRAYAEELVAMSPAQRAEERKKNEAMGGVMALERYSEEAVEAMREELAKGGASQKIKVRYVKDVQTEKSIRLTKGQAMYILLMYEQPTYTERLQEQGYTEEFMEKLRAWMGEDVVAFAYGLRDIVAENTPKLKEVYERQFGVPFPAEENYFPARWNVPDQKNDLATTLSVFSGEPGASADFLKKRVLHNHPLDTTRDALQVMLQAMTLSDTWMYTQDIVADLNAYMRDRRFGDAMTVALGQEGYRNFKTWADLLSKGGAQQVVDMGVVQDGVDKLYSMSSVALLGLRIQTWFRQLSAYFNGLMSAYDLSTPELIASLARGLAGKNPMTYKRMAQSDWYRNRKAGHATMRRGQAMRANDEKASRFEEGMEWAMQPMEEIDARLTASGLVPVWNAYYNRALKKGASTEAAEQAAWELTIDCANRGSQPIGWINRSKMAQDRNAFVRASMFMLSEDLNKLGLCVSLWKGGHKAAATRAWLVYGACNAAISAFLDCVSGDPDDWEDAHWWEYMLSAIYGPMASCPGLGELVESAGTAVVNIVGHAFDNEELQKAKTRASVGRAVVDLQGMWKAGAKLYDMLTNDHEDSISDYTKQVVRIGRPPAILGGALVGGTVGYGLLSIMTLMNPIDFGAKVWNSFADD